MNKMELYGGPLDGCRLPVDRTPVEGQEVEFDLVVRRYTREVDAYLNRREGTAVHIMRGGRLEFSEQREKTIQC